MAPHPKQAPSELVDVYLQFLLDVPFSNLRAANLRATSEGLGGDCLDQSVRLGTLLKEQVENVRASLLVTMNSAHAALLAATSCGEFYLDPSLLHETPIPWIRHSRPMSSRTYPRVRDRAASTLMGMEYDSGFYIVEHQIPNKPVGRYVFTDNQRELDSGISLNLAVPSQFFFRFCLSPEEQARLAIDPRTGSISLAWYEWGTRILHLEQHSEGFGNKLDVLATRYDFPAEEPLELLRTAVSNTTVK